MEFLLSKNALRKAAVLSLALTAALATQAQESEGKKLKDMPWMPQVSGTIRASRSPTTASRLWRLPTS